MDDSCLRAKEEISKKTRPLGSLAVCARSLNGTKSASRLTTLTIFRDLQRRTCERIASMKNLRTHIYPHLVIVLLCFGIGAHCAAQQSQTGQINGHVVDITGAVIPRASVFVRRNMPSDESVRLVGHTDLNGDFELVLPEGGYDVLVASPGFAAGVQTVPIVHGKKRRFEWKLKELGCDFPGVNCDTFQ